MAGPRKTKLGSEVMGTHPKEIADPMHAELARSRDKSEVTEGEPGEEGGPDQEMVQNILTDWDDYPVDTVVLWGYLVSRDDRHWRLYLTPEFNEYVDFLKDTDGPAPYVHHVPVTNSPVGGSIVWIRRSARLRHTVVRSATEVADFLRGQINVNFLAQTGIGNAFIQSVQHGQQRGRVNANASIIGGGCGSAAFPPCKE
jgi:hypothetical protein